MKFTVLRNLQDKIRHAQRKIKLIRKRLAANGLNRDQVINKLLEHIFKVPASKQIKNYESVKAHIDRYLKEKRKKIPDPERIADELIKQIDEGSVCMEIDIGYDTSESEADKEPEPVKQTQPKEKEVEEVKSEEKEDDPLNILLNFDDDRLVHRLESRRDNRFRPDRTIVQMRRTFF